MAPSVVHTTMTATAPTFRSFFLPVFLISVTESLLLPSNGEVHDGRHVLILGCSVDRYAINYFCRIRNSTKTKPKGFRKVQARSCYDANADATFSYVLIPGTGYDGSLQPPFFTGFMPDTQTIVSRIAPAVIGARPDMVVVDSSLWDLANWQLTKGEEQPFDVAKRVGKWCAHALPTLLDAVSGAFPNSRVVFRTAPATLANCTTKKEGGVCWHPGIDLFHECVMNSLSGGKLFGRHDVIDYYKIMAELWKTHDPVVLYREKDQVHPSTVPALHYFNAIFALLGLDSAIADLRQISEAGSDEPGDDDDDLAFPDGL